MTPAAAPRPLSRGPDGELRGTATDKQGEDARAKSTNEVELTQETKKIETPNKSGRMRCKDGRDRRLRTADTQHRDTSLHAA